MSTPPSATVALQAVLDSLGIEVTRRDCQAAVDAAAPHIAAQTLRDAAEGVAAALVNEIGSGHTSTYSVRRWLHELADRAEAIR